jgi:hypothetical protein
LVVAVATTACVFAAGAAAAVEVNQRFSYTAATFSCSGELITIEADIHLLGRVTYDANGGSHLGSTVTTFFTGVSASGDTYVGPSHQTTAVTNNPQAASTHTETFHANFIRTGEGGTQGDDLMTGAVFHFTIDANGNLTSYKFDFTAECN